MKLDISIGAKQAQLDKIGSNVVEINVGTQNLNRNAEKSVGAKIKEKEGFTYYIQENQSMAGSSGNV